MKIQYNKFFSLKEESYKPIRIPLEGIQTWKIHGYHSTSADYWESIRQKGLIPGKMPSPGQSWKPEYKAVYLHQEFPEHELDQEDFTTIHIEVQFSIRNDYVICDEDYSLDPNDTLEAYKEKAALAIGNKIPPKNIIKVHLPDLQESRDWWNEMETKQKGKFKVQWHRVDGTPKNTNIESQDQITNFSKIQDKKGIISYLLNPIPISFVMKRFITKKSISVFKSKKDEFVYIFFFDKKDSASVDKKFIPEFIKYGGSLIKKLENNGLIGYQLKFD